MSTLSQALRYFLKRNTKLRRVPLQYVNMDDIAQRGNRDEQLLMMGGYARSPTEARLLLNGQRAVDYIREHPRPPRGSTIRERFVFWIMRLQGARLGNPYHRHKKVSQLETRYRFK